MKWLHVITCGISLLPAGCNAERTHAAAPKVMLIGLDGADLRQVERLAALGRLPNLSRLMQRGIGTPLETVENSSPIIWTSVATGMLPEKHGIEFFRKDEVVARSTMRKTPAFWNILTHFERTVGTLAWWASFPAETVNGFIVSQYVVFQGPSRGEKVEVVWSSVDGHKTYPPELASELAEHLYTEEDITDEEVGTLCAKGKTRSTRWVFARDRSYYEMALQLIETDPVETLAVYFQGIDVASHDLTRHVFGANRNLVRKRKVSQKEADQAMERVENMYAHIDGLVGGLLEHAGPETDVIVVSDHGWEYDGTSHWNLNPGVFIAAGPSFVPGAEPETISVLDITPILLRILGLPLSREFDGRVPEGILEADLARNEKWVDSYPIPPVAVDATGLGKTAEDEEMLDALRTLGYVK